MSPKELMYLEDAMGHAKFLATQCQDAANQLQDGELKKSAQQMADKHKQLFNQFYQLM